MTINTNKTALYNNLAAEGTLLAPTINAASTPTNLNDRAGNSNFVSFRTAAVTGLYGCRRTFTSIDLTGKDYVLISFVQEQFNSTSNMDTIANGGLRVYLEDSGGNYSGFNIYGSDGGNNIENLNADPQFQSNNTRIFIFEISAITPDVTSGTLDLTDNVAFELHVDSVNSDIYELAVCNIDEISPPIATGTETIRGISEEFLSITDQTVDRENFELFRRGLDEFSGNSQRQYNTYIGLELGDGTTTTSVTESNFSVGFLPTHADYVQYQYNAGGPYIQIDGPRPFIINQSATDTIALTDFTISCSSLAFFEVKGSSLGTCTPTRGTINNLDYAILRHGDYTDIIFDNIGYVSANLDTTADNSQIRRNESGDRGLYIQTAPGDYSALDFTVSDNAGDDITIDATSAGTYDLTSIQAASGYTVNIHNESIYNITVEIAAGITTATSTDGGTVTISQPSQTFTLNSDTATTLIRYFDDDLQTIVDSTTGTTLAYEFTDVDPIDVELVKQGYVPVNRQDIVPTDGGSLDILMDFDEAYNSANGLTIATEYDYVRATKVLTINSDQEALDVRSSLADVIRTNSGYYNTPLLMDAIPGLTRIDLTDGMTITSMATWKGAGMEQFDSADSSNPVEKWFSIKSLTDITGASIYYRQTSSGSATLGALTGGVVNEAFQYWSDPNHDGSTADGYDYSGYMVIKSMLAGSKEGRVDVVVASGLSALQSNLYTIGLSNLAGGYSGADPGVTANLTLIAGGTVGGESFSYEWVDGATTSSADIANQIHYNKINIPNTVIAGGTGLTWWEISDAVIFNGLNVETERGYEEGASPALVGFYVSRSSVDHPGFTRFQADNGNYYTPTDTVLWTAASFLDDSRVRLYNVTQAAEIDNSTISGGGGYSYTLVPSIDFNSGDQITMLATYQELGVAKEVFRFSTTVTTADVTISDSQVDWEDHNTVGIDGDPTNITECSTDYVAIQVEVNDSDNSTTKARIAAFIVDALTTEDGIRNWVSLAGTPVIDYVNAGSAIVDVTVADVKIDNIKNAALDIVDTFKLRASDGSSLVDDSTFTINFDNSAEAVVVETGVSGLTAGESDDLALIGTVDVKIGTPVVDVSSDIADVKSDLAGKSTFDPASDVLENGKTYENQLRVMHSALAGKSAKAGTTETFRDDADTKDRITATTDSNGQRTTITTDGT